MKNKRNSEKLIRVRMDTENPPAFTKAQMARIKALIAMPDDQIDTSDIPPTPDSFWDNAVRGKYYRPVKTSTTVRIDADVLAWLRQPGAGYQSRINAILREAMLRARPGGLSEAAAPFKAAPAKRR